MYIYKYPQFFHTGRKGLKKKVSPGGERQQQVFSFLTSTILRRNRPSQATCWPSPGRSRSCRGCRWEGRRFWCWGRRVRTPSSTSSWGASSRGSSTSGDRPASLGRRVRLQTGRAGAGGNFFNQTKPIHAWAQSYARHMNSTHRDS